MSASRENRANNNRVQNNQQIPQMNITTNLNFPQQSKSISKPPRNSSAQRKR